MKAPVCLPGRFCLVAFAQFMPQEQRLLAVSPMTLDVLGGIPGGTDHESTVASDAFTRLRDAFERAMQEYETGCYRAAADAFMAAAREGKLPAENRAHMTLSESRSAAYRNAARAWYMAGLLDAARPQLELAAAEDSSCQEDIVQILGLLDVPPGRGPSRR